MVALAHAFFARLRPRDQGYLYIPLVRRVAGQIDGATRRVPKGMAVVLGEARNKVAVRSGRNPKGRGPVRLGSVDCAVARCGLTFIARLNMPLRKTSSTLKINPRHPMRFNEGCRADWAVLDTLAVSRYCLRISAVPGVQQPYGAATTGI